MKKKTVKIKSKELSISAPKTDKVRLAIQCTAEERKYIKMHATHEDQTLNEYVLEAVKMRMNNCPRSHIPNKQTSDVLDAAEHGEDLIQYDSIKDFFKSMEK